LVHIAVAAAFVPPLIRRVRWVCTAGRTILAQEPDLSDGRTQTHHTITGIIRHCAQRGRSNSRC
jgi:hypothetical protein